MTPGGYVHVEKLGEGSWTTLYRAVRTNDARPILLEVLNAEHCLDYEPRLFANQLELGNELRNGPVVTPLALSTFDGRPALELEHSIAAPLDSLLGAALPVEDFVDLALRLTSALAILHERGIVHGSLLPRYILWARETGAIELSGFWHTQRATREGLVQRPLLLLPGSLPYVSPEQTGRLNRMVDRRSDLYSLGVIFFQLLTGRLPFDGKDAMGWVHCHVARRPPAPTERVPSVPPVLSSVVLKLLEKAPEERYQSAAGLLHDLRRCQEGLRAQGKLDSFPIARADISEAFTIPHRLYGRERELARLLELHEEVASGARARFVLISGAAGTGKSLLVYELQRPCAARGGRFVSGKFDQYRWHVPYAALVDALRELALDVLAESAERTEDYRQKIAAALGMNAPLVCGLVPQFSLILGPQPPTPELPPSEIQKRLWPALRRLLAVFATEEHSLTIFLDDLQWADAASVELVLDLVGDPELRYLLIVAATRDSDAGALHALHRARDGLTRAGAAIHELRLGALSPSDLAGLVADLTRAPQAETSAFARVIHEKTAGNPLFVVQLLSELHRRGFFSFDNSLGHWRWDPAAVMSTPCSENVTELLVAKLRELPAENQVALGVAAYLGRDFGLDTLRRVIERDPGPAIRAAVDDGLLAALDQTYRFPHDRVQEAAYSLIPESERAATHLRIGRLLLAITPHEELDGRSFAIVNHLNRAVPLLTSQEERERVARLDLAAGRRARASAAHACAREYFEAGSALLAADAWESNYDLAFALALGQAECEISTSQLAAAEARLAELEQRARGFLDQAAVACAQETLCSMRSEFDRSLELLLNVLRRAGIEWSREPSENAIREEYERLRQRIGDRAIEELTELGVADAHTEATTAILLALNEKAATLDDRLMRLAVCRAGNLSLERGHCDASTLAFVSLGQMLGPYFGDYSAGFRFTRLGLQLQERRGDSRFRGRALALAGAFVYPWTQPFEAAIELLRRGHAACLEEGNLTFAWLALNAELSIRLLAADPLADVERVVQRVLAFTHKAKLGALYRDMIIPEERLVRVLRGLTPGFSFDDADFSEAEFEAHLAADSNLVLAEGWYWIRKLQARYFGGDHAAALAAAERADALAWTTGFAMERIEHQLYAALALAAHWDEAAADERPAHRARLAEYARLLEERARDCHARFACCSALVAAELARVEGDDNRAALGYEEAIRLARGQDWLSILALGYEVAARFYRARGFVLIADTYLQEACNAYHRWGAEGKVRQLEQHYPSLARRAAAGAYATLGVRSEELDLLAVIKASQTISGVILQDELLDTLLHVVLEQGGARRARLVLVNDPNGEQELRVAAEASIDEAAPLLQPAPRVPNSIVEYVRRTGSSVVLDDAAADTGRFAKDPYWERARPRSVLCLPVRLHGAIAGILYLDNDLVPGVFTRDKLLTLELLATQAAISLQNAELLARERAAREHAQRERGRALLLGEATAILSESPNLAGLSEVVSLVCARGLADWAVLDATEGVAPKHLAFAHRDAAKEPLLRQFVQRDSSCFRAAPSATHTLAANAPLHQPWLSDEQIRQYCIDDEHAALSRKLGLRSILIVPLVARGARLGALFLMAATPHQFEAGDVELGIELGRRLAMAIEGARLAELESRLLQSQKMEAIGRLAGSVAHDFNNLLSVILTYSQIVSDRLEPTDPIREDVEEVRKAGVRGADLTRQLLAFSRHRLVEPQVVDLNRVVTTAKNMLATLLGSRIVLVFKPTHPLWPVRADPSQLEQVLMNLAANARDAMPAGGKLLVETSNVELDEAHMRAHLGVIPGEYVMLSVTDTGSGIAHEVQGRIFEPFFTTKKPGQGTGLGLATVFGIVQQSGGHVSVESEVGRGTTFRIYLPRCAASAASTAAAIAVKAVPPPLARTSMRGKETILLVEDEEHVRSTARTALEYQGYSVLEASGPGDALLICEQYPEVIHVLLSDVLMPRMTGPELAERVVAARPSIRVIFMSGYTDTPLSGLVRAKEPAEFLQKPFTPEALTERIRRVLSRASVNGTDD
jgi:predicted ATPase/signal transduction histidine kinase/CheY-like chemotaxis protein